MHRVGLALLVILGCSGCSSDTPTTPAIEGPRFAVTVSSQKNLPYTAADGGTQTFDAYRASTTVLGNAPAVVYVAGGGWQKVGLESDVSSFYLAKLPIKGPWVVFAPRYRVGLGIWPAQEEDVRCFIRYLRYNAVTLGIDRNRIYAVGHSAGGHIVARIARDAESASVCYQGTSSGLKAAATLSAPSDLLALDQFNADAASFIPNVFGDSVARRLASPALTGGPCTPLFVAHGKKDSSVFYSNGQKLAGACAPWGSQLMLCDEGGHSLLQTTCKTTVLNAVVAHFKRY
jgi:acetyl esterase/lipase